jgi:hypothetical protein
MSWLGKNLPGSFWVFFFGWIVLTFGVFIWKTENRIKDSLED